MKKLLDLLPDWLWYLLGGIIGLLLFILLQSDIIFFINLFK